VTVGFATAQGVLATRLSERLKRNKLHVFDHCGHFSYQDKHEEFGDVVAEWVSDGYSKL
jgi:pimeloyl-ACP methyl ester carboxylesterase